MQGNSRHASWRELLAAPPPASHIVQIYDGDDFLVGGVALFAAEGLRRGEVVLLIGTRAHLAGVRGALASYGIDADLAVTEGRLSLIDAADAIARITAADRMPDPERFEAALGQRLGVVAADPRFCGVRWWGEISSMMQLAGDERAALRAEELADAAAKERGFTLFCSYLFDRFDAQAYSGLLREVCGVHSHVIPAEDYVRHRLAVNRAIAEVIGEIKGPLLQSLLSWKGLACDLPSSQALLFWVRDTLPEHFEDVLSRAKAYQFQESA